MDDLFKARLVIQAALYPRAEILERMGYTRPSPTNLARLESVLNSSACGLDKSGFDFRFSAEGFLQTLCSAIGIEAAAVDAFIAKQKQALEQERSAFKPWIWVDTDFIRKNQPIFALAACEHLRTIDLPKGTWRLPLEGQLSVAAAAVRLHFLTNAGKLGIWGGIQRYWFCSGHSQRYLLDCEGQVADATSDAPRRLSSAMWGLSALTDFTSVNRS